MSKRVVVTGIDGFIGKHTIPFLNKIGYEIHGISRKEYSHTDSCIKHSVDLSDSSEVDSLLKVIKPTHLLHFAWCTEHGKYWNSEENVDWVGSSCRLLRSFVKYGGVRAVIAGTSAEYEWSSPVYNENTSICKPSTLYGIAKNSLFQVVKKYAELTNLSLAWGRLFFTFGPGENKCRLIPYIINSLFANKSALCKNGDAIRDFLYVKDVANWFTILLGSGLEGAVNVGSGKGLTIRELVTKIASMLDKTNLLNFENTAGIGEPQSIIADISKLSSLQSDYLSTPLEQAIDETIAWWSRARPHPGLPPQGEGVQ